MGIEDASRSTAEARPARVLALWVVLALALHAAQWVLGFREAALAEGVEQGAARIERQGVGEIGDDAIRDAIRLQVESLRFWEALIALADFVGDPLAIVLRALLAATALGSVAALTGRPVGFERGLEHTAAVQGFWVLGLAVRVGLMVALRRTEVLTSAALLLPPGEHPAVIWEAFRQVDAFALIGWAALARGGWRRGQANPAVSVLVVAALAVGEVGLRLGFALLVGAGMRLTLLPE